METGQDRLPEKTKKYGFNIPTARKTQFQTFDNKTLYGTLTVAGGPFAALILPGSGIISDDGDVSNSALGSGYKNGSTKLSIQLSEKLLTEDISSFRFEKRGYRDPNEIQNHQIQYLVQDAKSALAFLRNELPEKKIVLVGFSEGAIISMLLGQSFDFQSVHLLAPPTRHIDEILLYQCFEWPSGILKQLLEDSSTTISKKSFQNLGILNLPVSGLPIEDLFKDRESIQFSTFETHYDELLQATKKAIIESPLAPWYQSMTKLPEISVLAGSLNCKVFLYQPSLDAQLSPKWIKEDQKFFRDSELLEFKNLGHCFSPMDGKYKEIKTAGPLSKDLLDKLVHKIVYASQDI